jgi:tRNA(Ile)-lysidine synthase
MALLHVLYDIHQRWEPPLRLEVVHFNHGLRPEAIDEEALVQEAAQNLGVPVHVCHWSEGAGDSKGIQSRARAWRRANSEALLAAGGAQVEAGATGSIATAHHGDDQVETFTLKLLRGAHLSHLRGMDYRQGLYIKPLLGLTKDSLAQYLETKGVQWLEDASNAQDKYRRNKVRLRLLPLMQDIAGGEEALRTRVEELSRQSRGLDAWLEMECERWEGQYTGTQAGLRADEMPIPQWRPLPQMLQEALLHRFVGRVGGLSLAYGQVERLREQLYKGEAQWQVYVGHGWAADCQGDVLRLMWLEGEEGPRVEQRAGDLTLLYPQGWSVRAERLTAQAHGETGKTPWPVVLFNVPQGARLELRTRREGDRFWPAWRSSAIKMKDFLRGQKLPLHRRDSVPLAVMGDQQVVCVYPSHVSAAHATQNMEVAPVGLWIETDLDKDASGE